MTLDEIIAEQFKRARREMLKLAPDEMLVPLFAGYSETGMVLAVGSPFTDRNRSKVIAATVARELLRQKGCVAYSVTSEAWLAEDTTGALDLGRLPKGYVMPADRPDRREVVTIYAETAEGYCKGGTWETKRKENGRVLDLVPLVNSRGDDEGIPIVRSETFGGLLRPEGVQ